MNLVPIAVEIDGRIVRGFAQNLGGALWAHFEGESFVIEPPAKASRRGGKSSASSDPGTIVSPMPGKIAKVHVSVGDAVETGRALITLEAMKMEYALKAAKPGRVREVKCKAGDQVTLGQTLALLEIEG